MSRTMPTIPLKEMPDVVELIRSIINTQEMCKDYPVPYTTTEKLGAFSEGKEYDKGLYSRLGKLANQDYIKKDNSERPVHISMNWEGWTDYLKTIISSEDIEDFPHAETTTLLKAWTEDILSKEYLNAEEAPTIHGIIRSFAIEVATNWWHRLINSEGDIQHERLFWGLFLPCTMWLHDELMPSYVSDSQRIMISTLKALNP